MFINELLANRGFIGYRQCVTFHHKREWLIRLNETDSHIIKSDRNVNAAEKN
jgi:hypothetical protein